MSPTSKSLIVRGVMTVLVCVVVVLLPMIPGVAPAPRSRPRPEFLVRGTVVDVKIAGEVDVIDACAGWIEADRAWAVRLRVDESLEGEIGREELTILVHSPEADLGVERVGQVVEVSLDRLEGEPHVFIPSDAPGGIPDLSQVAFEVVHSVGR